jgi:hypothetical protein
MLLTSFRWIICGQTSQNPTPSCLRYNRGSAVMTRTKDGFDPSDTIEHSFFETTNEVPFHAVNQTGVHQIPPKMVFSKLSTH